MRGGELLPWGGRASGEVTSAAWSDTLGACVEFAYLWRQDGAAVTAEDVKGVRYDINVGGTVQPATISLRPLFDPANDRIRA
jgi:glycine cleavage system aminomethyltransferase T